MTHRQRALTAMRGGMPDRVPFIGRMDLWYDCAAITNTLPEKYRGWSLAEIQRDMDIGIFGRGATWTNSFYALETEGVTVETIESELETVTRYHTPYGTLQTRLERTRDVAEAGIRGLQVEYPYKSPDDYDALLYVIEHTWPVGRLEEYGRMVEEIGEDGLALPYTNYVPMHLLMHSYMGYDTFYLELFDRPEKVARVHDALLEQHRALLRLATQCPVEVVEVGGNYDETMTPPPIFEQYFKPFYIEAAGILNRAGKLMAIHGDGEMKGLLELFPGAGVQVIEAITPQPMTSIDMHHIRQLYEGRVTLWGGIPTVVLTSTFSEDQFRRHVEDLWEAVAPGDRFILGFGDNVPTDAVWSRIEWLCDFVAENGALPITPRKG